MKLQKEVRGQLADGTISANTVSLLCDVFDDAEAEIASLRVKLDTLTKGAVDTEMELQVILARAQKAEAERGDLNVELQAECELHGAAIARAMTAEGAIDRVRALAEWHETKADKARRFPGDAVEVMEKAAQVHDDAARRLREALTGPS